MNNKNGLFIAFTITFWFFFFYAKGQPENYWSVSFNTEASLLSGAVVGGNSGITSIYYNPAGISEIKDKQFALNASLFSLEYENYKNAIGNNQNISSLLFRVQPRFISYLYRLKSDTTLSIQFVILNRNNLTVNSYKNINYPISLINKDIEEVYFGNTDFKSDYSDYWGGAGSSFQINENLSVGASLFVSVKNFSYFKSIEILVNPDINKFPDTATYYSASWSVYQKLEMYDVRLLGKLGIRYNYNNFSFGLNISLPSVRLFGNGDVKKITSQSGITDSSATYPDINYYEVGNYMLSQFKDPFSAAIGVVYTTPSEISKFYFTAEYFGAIKKYKTVDGTKCVYSCGNNNSTTTTDFSSYYYAAKSVVNFALGFQTYFLKNIDALFGFRTNFNPRRNIFDDTDKSSLNEFINTSVNTYYFTGGGQFRYKKTKFLLGLQLGTGHSKNNLQFVNFYNVNLFDDETNLALQGKRQYNMTHTYVSLSLFLGFVLGL